MAPRWNMLPGAVDEEPGENLMSSEKDLIRPLTEPWSEKQGKDTQ